MYCLTILVNNVLVNANDSQKSILKENESNFHKRISGVFDFMKVLSSNKIQEKILNEKDSSYENI